MSNIVISVENLSKSYRLGQIGTGILSRDLRFLVQFGVQLLMYATPVIYPASAIPARFQWVIKLNPMAPIVETFRFAFLGGGSVHPVDLIYSFGFMVVIVIIGAVMFNHVEATFMDTV